MHAKRARASWRDVALEWDVLVVQAPTSGNHRATLPCKAPWDRSRTNLNKSKAQLKRSAQRVCWSHRYVGPTLTELAERQRRDPTSFELEVRSAMPAPPSTDLNEEAPSVELLAKAFAKHVAVTPKKLQATF